MLKSYLSHYGFISSLLLGLSCNQDICAVGEENICDFNAHDYIITDTFNHSLKLIGDLIEHPEWKSYSMLYNMIHIKCIIEDFSWIDISIEKEIKKVNSALKKKGKRLTKNQIRVINDEINRIINTKFDNRLRWEWGEIECCQDILDRVHNNEKKIENNTKIQKVPPRIAYGISLSLSGAFLYMLPIPVAKTAGTRIFEAGILLLVDGIIEFEEKDDSEKAKKKTDGG